MQQSTTLEIIAAADLLDIAPACFITLVVAGALGWVWLQLYPSPVEYTGFRESDSDATFADDLSETGIAAGTVKLPAGAQLVEIDTAGMLTPPDQVFLHEYVWTGSAVQFVRRVPLSQFDYLIPGSAMHAASHPDALAAGADFLSAHRPLAPADQAQL